MRAYIFAIWALTATTFATSKPAFTGQDFTGIYDCKGQDSSEGPYTSTVTLSLVTDQSVGKHGAYSFKMEVPGYGTYPGHAVTSGTTAAIYFALTDPTPKDFGTGIAQFSKLKSGKWRFDKHYYEPEFKGGNYGNELCAQR